VQFLLLVLEQSAENTRPALAFLRAAPKPLSFICCLSTPACPALGVCQRTKPVFRVCANPASPAGRSLEEADRHEIWSGAKTGKAVE